MPLITKIEELKEYNAPANLGIAMDSFFPSCKFIEKKILKPVIGTDLYDVLTDAYEASILESSPVELTEPMADLLAEVRAMLAPLSILHYKHSTLSILSDAGSTERSLEKGEPVRMWVNNLQSDTLFNEGMDAIDMLLTFLEENKGDYPDWVQSDAYTEFHQFLMQNTKEFDDEVKIGSSRRLFKALRPDIKFAELQVIKKNIGADLYNRLLTGRKEDSLTQDEIELLAMIQPVTANFAMAHSALPVEVDNDGVFSLFTSSEFSGFKSSKKAPDADELERMRKNYYRRAQVYLDDLITHLNTTATEDLFPEYFSSELYDDPDDDDDETPPNETYSGVFTA